MSETNPTTTARDADTKVEEETAEFVREHPSVTVVGRAGWCAKGVVYLVAGILALVVMFRAFGWKKSDSGEASPTGALKEVAEHSFGSAVLLVLGVGLVAYAIWRLISAAMPGRRDAKVIVTRVAYVISAGIYAAFAWTAFRLVGSEPQSTDGNSQVTGFSERIMRHTGGRLVVGAVGVVMIGAGIYRIVKGWKADVVQEMDTAGMSPERRTWTRRIGAVGEVGRGVALALIGFFLTRAAIQYDVEQATGLDGALRRAATEGWSRILVALVAVGFVCYGVFCLTTFTRRRFEAPR